MSPYLRHGPRGYVEDVPRAVAHPDDTGDALVEHDNRDYTGDYVEHAEDPDDEALAALAGLLPLSVITPAGQPPALPGDAQPAQQQPAQEPAQRVEGPEATALRAALAATPEPEQPAEPAEAAAQPGERRRSMSAAAARAIGQPASASTRARIDAAAAEHATTGGEAEPGHTGPLTIPPVEAVSLTPVRGPQQAPPAEADPPAVPADERAVVDTGAADTLGPAPTPTPPTAAGDASARPARVRPRRSAP